MPLLGCAMILAISSCGSPPSGNNSPQITFIGMDRDTLLQGTNGFGLNITLPLLPQNNDGQRGTIQLEIFRTCCIYPDEDPCTTGVEGFPTNQLTFDISIRDNSGNVSNSVTTGAITLVCN